MAEPGSIVSVRELKGLSVLLDDALFHVSLAKSSNDSIHEFLDEAFCDFERKVARLTSRKFHSVCGVSILSDDSLKCIFRELIRVPYEEDGLWLGTFLGSSGAIRLCEPTSGAVVQPTGAGGGTKESKVTRSITVVCRYHMRPVSASTIAAARL